jgi:hypothetical protein
MNFQREQAVMPVQINFHFGTGFLAGMFAASVSVLAANLALLYTIRNQLKARDIVINRPTIIDFLAGILSDIMEHPAVDAALSHTIARGVNRWMSSKEAQDAIRSMIMQTPRAEAVRELGKEVPGYVMHFAGGFVDAITGNKNNSYIQKQEEHAGHPNDEHNSSTTTAVSSVVVETLKT